MQSNVLLSVALVTKNRPASLERTLASLRAQEVQPFEVIISDDSNPDKVPAIEALARGFDCSYSRGPSLIRLNHLFWKRRNLLRMRSGCGAWRTY